MATTRIGARIAAGTAYRRRAAEGVVAGLRTLRGLVDRLDPGDLDRPEAYLARHERARPRVDAALVDVGAHLDALVVELAARRQDERALTATVDNLRRYAVLASRLDEALAARLDELGLGDPARATRLRDDVLIPVRSRRRDLLLHLEVATQSLLGLRAMDAHDETLREAVALVRTTTVAALDAAALLARMTAERRDRQALGDALGELRRSWHAAANALASADGSAA